MTLHRKRIITYTDLLEFEETVDVSIAGMALGGEDDKTRLAEQGAHDPVPTQYFVLEKLFGYYSFDANSHLLDVGCGLGRVLAHFVRQGYPGRATGIELDPELATKAQAWTARYPKLEVLQGSALDIDLSPYTDFYLFNPFDTNVLEQFLTIIECQTSRTVTLIHMSDNGDYMRYIGRLGWTELASGYISSFINDRGHKIKAYEDAQHYTVWRHENA